MILVAPSGMVVEANSEIERLFGYCRDEIVGRSVDLLVPDRLRDDHARLRALHIEEPGTPTCGRDLIALRKDGIEFPVELHLKTIATVHGVLIVELVVDLSARKRKEQLKDDFVFTVSHELRTPLTSIAGALGLLAGSAAGALPDAAARLLAIAQKNSARLVRLINDLLDIARMEAGDAVFVVKRVVVRPLVEQVIEASRGYAVGTGITFKLESAPAFPVDVRADPDRLTQVLANLLSNAIKFSPAGAEVAVAISAFGGGVRISVRDHGPGIPAAFRDRIYERFARADAAQARDKGGTGLGLSIVRSIIVRLGGSVSFGDAPGGGTVFQVDLPAWETETNVFPLTAASAATQILAG